ncbi:TetR/AcrR family transcriptional regulator C-terminal domain-containing protein [Streptomyces sp. LP05-1]|uniref:TetR/AcrR family transcriptional regulator C-terminal domain-containing protein n=1 Tax=Streptomyces pyxinae TaxID=2970734 RepID=A0ABT2CH61_9ACTN|nr:TetR/AcrR family transcriptional regulator C-terminal domain-containing protein [Streptomyces sp. LP05-1]MCS0636757.1 TetR/AcrR family transcriptional regulator C-terminal domain-containing protein [Streptomyces sp. LP05-1]
MVKDGTERLDRAKVAATALRLLGDCGLEGLTLRAIARELGVKAPALYWHFKDKQALLDEMATEMFRRMTAETATAVVTSADWPEALSTAMRGLRSQLLRYRDGAKIYSGTRFTDLSYAGPLETYLTALTGAGFTLPAAARAWFTAYSYTIGYVIEEQAMGPVPGPDAGGTGDVGGAKGYDVAARAERLADFPLAAAMGPEVFGDDRERGFEAGLAAVVAGIGATLGPAAPAADRPAGPYGPYGN